MLVGANAHAALNCSDVAGISGAGGVFRLWISRGQNLR